MPPRLLERNPLTWRGEPLYLRRKETLSPRMPFVVAVWTCSGSFSSLILLFDPKIVNTAVDQAMIPWVNKNTWRVYCHLAHHAAISYLWSPRGELRSIYLLRTRDNRCKFSILWIKPNEVIVLQIQTGDWLVSPASVESTGTKSTSVATNTIYISNRRRSHQLECMFWCLLPRS